MSEERRIFCEGTCHCGGIAVRMRSDGDLLLRACQCGFCRRHGAGTVADPDGELALYANDAALNRYQFDARTADFILCQKCGTYIAALVSSEAGHFATLNVMGIDPKRFDGAAQEPVSYDGEGANDRRARRLRAWTPTIFHDRRDFSQDASV